MSRNNIKDHASSFINEDLYLPTRTLYIGPKGSDGELDEAMLERAIKNLHVLDNLPRQDSITIIMNNPGGSVIDGMGLYDTIHNCKNYIRIKIYGQASSMGSIILQACDERVLSENSMIMIHDGTRSYDEMHKQNIKNWDNYFDKLDEWCYNLYLEKIREKNPKFRKDKLKKMLVHDKILSAKEAVELGLADRILKRGE